MPTYFDTRQSVNRSALSMIGSAANDTLDTVLSKIDSELAKVFEDRNIVLADGGVISFVAAGTSVTFTQALKLHINSQVAGGAPTIVDLTSTTRAFSANLRMLYAVINRSAGTATITADSATLPAQTSANQEVVLIAKRIDSADGAARLYFRGGFSLSAGQSSRLGSAATFYTSEFAIQDQTDTTKKLLTSASGSTTSTSTTLLIAQTANRVLTLPDATDTLVGKATTDVLTNKTIQFLRQSVATDAATTGTNTTLAAVTTGIVRITNASLVSLSGIPAGLSGQSLTIENQTGVQITINNDEATASSGNRIYTGSGTNVSMPNNSTFVFTYDTTATKWMLTGGSGSGSGSGTGINWITNFNIEAAITGYNTYADAAGTSPVDGTGGSPNVTISRSTTTPLDGLADLNFVKDAANRQGQGFSYDFTIDRAYQGTIQQISFNYEVLSGTYASGDMTVWIYDVTNGVLLPQPSGNSIISTSVPSQQGQCTFQTAINSTSYRLIFHVTTTSTAAYTLAFDNFSVGPQVNNNGAFQTSPTTYTPVFTGFGTVSAVNFKSWRVGKFLKIQGTFTTGTVTGTEARITLGSDGVSGNVTSSSGYATLQLCGYSAYGQTNAAAGTVLIEASKTYLTFGNQANATIGLLKGTGSAINASNTTMSIFAEVEIEGWGSNAVMSTSANTRNISFSAYRSANQTGINTNNSDVKVAIDTVSSDTIAGFNTSTNRYVIQVPGPYVFNASASILNTNVLANRYALQIFKNGVVINLGAQFDALANTGFTRQVSTPPILCVVGDFIEVFFNGSGNNSASTLTALGGATTTYFGGYLLQAPQQIAASESISARYFASTTTISGTLATVVWTTKDFDSHNAMSAGLYTVPAPGKYQVTASNAVSGTFVLNNSAELDIQKNGSPVSINIIRAAAAVSDMQLLMTDTINCIAGDVLRIQLASQGTSPAIVSSNTRNFICITRVGN